MYKASVFVSDIVEGIFGFNPTSVDFENLGIICDRTIFYKVIMRDSKYLNQTCAFALKNLIKIQIEENEKKTQLIEYFEKYLSESFSQFMKKNIDEYEKIVDMAIFEFLSPKERMYDVSYKNSFVHPDVKYITEIYLKVIKYLRTDIVTSFILLENAIDRLMNVIVDVENISCIKPSTCVEKIINTLSFKKIVPENIVCQIQHFKELFLKNKSIYLSDAGDEYLDVLFSNIKIIFKWFLCDYLKNVESFESVYTKIYRIFYNKNEEETKIYDVNELLKKGWSIREVSTTMLKLLHETVEILNPQNVTNVNDFEKVIKAYPETKQMLLNNNNEVIGLWSIIPLNQNTFEKAKKGEFFVGEINEYTTKMLTPDTNNNIHFAAICLKDIYRKSPIFNRLLFSFIEYIEKLALNKIFINEVVTKAGTKSGIILARSLGLKYIKDHIDEHGEIYHSTIFDLLEQPYMRDFHVLRRLYKEKFSNE